MQNICQNVHKDERNNFYNWSQARFGLEVVEFSPKAYGGRNFNRKILRRPATVWGEVGGVEPTSRRASKPNRFCPLIWPESEVYSMKTLLRDESDRKLESSGTKVSNGS